MRRDGSVLYIALSVFNKCECHHIRTPLSKGSVAHSTVCCHCCVWQPITRHSETLFLVLPQAKLLLNKWVTVFVSKTSLVYTQESTWGARKLIPQLLSTELGKSHKQLTIKPPATIKLLSIKAGWYGFAVPEKNTPFENGNQKVRPCPDTQRNNHISHNSKSSNKPLTILFSLCMM